MGYDFLFRDLSSEKIKTLKYITIKLGNNIDLKSLSNINKHRIDPFYSARTIKSFLNFWSLKNLSSWDIEIFRNEDNEAEDIHSISILQEIRDEFNYY